MRKIYSALLALALMMTVLSGCRGNVSSRKDGKITEPTATTGTVATMPSTDTAPIATAPSATTEETTLPAGTDSTGITEHTTETGVTTPSNESVPEGRARHAHPRDPMHRN